MCSGLREWCVRSHSSQTLLQGADLEITEQCVAGGWAGSLHEALKNAIARVLIRHRQTLAIRRNGETANVLAEPCKRVFVGTGHLLPTESTLATRHWYFAGCGAA
eukprot:EC793339.1.p2 GENE.EC793339.1~~EC793339.1.p2  ORF type:complete len:105 (-),score=14.27 EC793339.1:129-443(-)